MEQPPSNPMKKRPRFLTMAFVLVLVLLCSWWYWPRGDSRFVGTWAAHEGNGATPDFLLRLAANGSSTSTFPLQPWQSDYTAWKVENEKLIFGIQASAPVEAAVMQSQSLFNGIALSTKVWLNEASFDILNVAVDEIRLVSSSTHGRKQKFTLTLRRLRE